MHRIAVTALAAMTFSFTAHAGDVFVTRDAQGNPVFTDRPESLPAQKVNVATQSTDTVDAQRRLRRADEGCSRRRHGAAGSLAHGG